jgi:hypothetical protein
MKIRCGSRTHWLLSTAGDLLVLAAFAGPVLRPNPAAAARGDANAAALDLAAMVLTPLDLEDEGLAGYGVADGESRSPETVAAAYAFQRDLPEDEARDRFADAELRLAYEIRLEDRAEPGEEGACDCAHSATVTIYEFADDEGATAGLAILTDWEGVGTATAIENEATIGDEAVLVRHRGTTPEPYFALDLAVQVDNLTVVVRLADYTGEDPAIADVVRLAERQIERIQNGPDDGAAGVGDLTLRLGGDGVILGWDYYTVADGQLRRSVRLTPDEAATKAEELADAGLTAEFEISQRIAISGLVAEDAYLYSYVTQFETADAATDFLRDELDRAAEDDQFEKFTVLEDLTEYGDEAVAYAQTFHWAAHDVDLVYQTYVLRIDDRLAAIQLIAPVGLPVAVLEDLAAAQTACLEGEGCVNPAPLPADLRALVAATTTSEPEATEHHADALPSHERTWTGPTLGVELTYETGAWNELPWELFAEVPGIDGDDVLALYDEAGESVLTISAFAGTEGADDCVDVRLAGYAFGEERGRVRPVRDEAGAPLAADDDELAYATYAVTLDDGNHTFVYVECRSFADGEALLLVFQVGPLDAYEAGTEAREALLDGLELPDA